MTEIAGDEIVKPANSSVTLEPASEVPDKVTPAAFSAAFTSSFKATTSRETVGGTASTTSEFVVLGIVSTKLLPAVS